MSLDLEAALASIEAAESVDALVACLQGIANTCGFSSFSFIDTPRDGEREIFVLNTILKAFNDDYINENLVYCDPIIPVWRRTNTPFTWDQVPLPERRGKRLPGALKTMNVARDHGYNDGLVIPFHYVDKLGRHGSAACTFFWTDTISQLKFSLTWNRAKLHTILLYWAQKVIDISDLSGERKARFIAEREDIEPLSDREKEVLLWAARGKTVSETADILAISDDTVETHMRSCLKKLQAANKTHAVVQAIYLRLIDI